MKYVLKSHKQPYEVTVSYGEGGTLTGISFSEELSKEEFIKVLDKISYREEYLLAIFKNFPKLITAIPEDLSFEAFWNAYGYKKDKKVAERLWDRMKPPERAKAIAYIPRYHQHLKKNGVAQKYPKTYLTNEPWNDEN